MFVGCSFFVYFMKKIQKQYKKILQVLGNLQLTNFLRKRAVVFGIVALPLTSAGAGMTIYIDNMANIAQDPIFAQETVINLDEHITVEFTVPIRDIDEYEKVITTYPQTDMYFSWNDVHTVVEIMPKTVWQPQTQYSIAFPYNSQKADESLSTIFSFETIAYPEVIKTNITEKNNQYISEGEEILIILDKNIDDFDVHAVTRPILDTKQTYDKETRTLHVKIMEQTQNYKGFHSLTLFAKHKKQADAQFYPINSLTFNTLLPKPDVWPEQFDDRLTIAARSTAPRIKEGKYIDVNLDAQITTLFEDGKFVTNFVDSTGAEETPTPPGEYQIYNKHPYALSNMFQVYLPYWLAFTPDGLYGFHGLIVWPKGHEDMPQGGKESKKNIGNAVSAGCVRHDAQNSIFLYEWAEVGTKVVIY
jgi:lipoprotein-anchoring transpeptidase ErfK/SrfK